MKTVLVIEDNEDNKELITILLEKHGYQTLYASTGSAGVALALQALPDFILLDIQLPDIDGYEVLRRIRADAAGRSVPVIALTAYAMAGDRQQLLAAGCTGYIKKPIDPHEVINQIRDIVGAHG